MVNFKLLNINYQLRNILFFVFITVNSILSAQNTPILKFQKDSVLIGELTPVNFTYLHEADEEVLFADSTFDYSPFEFEKIEVYSTKTADSVSVDSVVYWFTTFELDKIQTLKIPVFVYSSNDSIPVYSNTDSIRLKEVITVVSDTLKIKENTDLQEVESEFNYPIVSIVLGVIIVVGILLLLIFWKKIILYFKLKRLSKLHQTFLFKFDELNRKFSNNQSKENLEELVVCWKKHLEKLQNNPITKLSTKELETFILDKTILETLKKSDRMIFGNIAFENSTDDIEKLTSFIENEYSIKVELLKNEGRN